MNMFLKKIIVGLHDRRVGSTACIQSVSKPQVAHACSVMSYITAEYGEHYLFVLDLHMSAFIMYHFFISIWARG
jgi:hypothetical protein